VTHNRVKVLVVDDSSVIRRQVSRTLARLDVDVVEADNGCSALREIEKESDWGLVICDLQMPEMDGMQLLGHLKRHESHARIPFVLLTSEVDPDLMLAAKEAGANGWLVKPVDSNQLLMVTKKLLARPAPALDTHRQDVEP